MSARILPVIGLGLWFAWTAGCDATRVPAPDLARQESATPDPGVTAAPSLESEATAPRQTDPLKAALPETWAPTPSAAVSELVRAAAVAATAAKTDDVRDALKQITLALHNFHDSYGAFPAVNGIGQPGAKTGLSWRVHLLPFLDEADLYNEFHRDEPWDSEHNLTLVKRMPKIFGSDPEGRTRFQVYTGEGGGFPADQGLRMAAITDGTSNTVAITYTGPDTTEIWTRPGDLTIAPAAPLKSLGDVGDRVTVAFFDGSVRFIPMSITPRQWLHLVNPKDGNLIGEIPPVPSPHGPEAVLKRDELAPLGPPKGALALTFIPQSALATVVLQPRRLLETPLVQELMNQAPARPGAATDLPKSERILPAGISEVLNRFGISLEQIEEVRLVVDRAVLESLQGREQPLASFGLVVHASVPWQVPPIVAEFLRNAGRPESVDVAGMALAVDGDSGLGLGFLDERHLVFGGTSVVEKMLTARNVDNEVTQRLHAAGDRAFVAAVDLSPVGPLLAELGPQVPPQALLVMPFVTQMQGLTLALDPTHAKLAALSASFQQPETAEGLFAMLDGQLQAGKAYYEKSRPSLSQGTTSTLVPILDELVSGATLAQTESRLDMSIGRPDKFEELPTALKPVFEEARRANDAVLRRNNLKFIALAMHNFESAFAHFPALDGMGDPKSAMKGKLSWRVYLLPYLDQYPLYQQFHLNEDWDSEHNRSLIARMPLVYGDNPEGQTRIHVLAGQGCPFSTGQGLRFRDLTDGSSNILMAVEAGPETADIWTKPGGLPFDPNDPLKCLGTLTESTILGVMFDGSVRTFGKNLAAETFRRLVLYNDGAPIAN